MGTERAALNRRAFAIASDLTLTPTERRELAAMIPSADVSPDGLRSWGTLTVDELAHLCIMLDGARLVRDLMRLR